MRRSAEEPENENDSFQDAFRRNLYSYRAPVGPQGWSRLEETLNNDSKDKRRGFITWLAAACAGLLLLSGSIIGYLNLQKSNPEIASRTVSKSAEKVTASNAPEATENSIAIAKTETQKVTNPTTFRENSTQNQATENQELNTVASNNNPESSPVASVAEQSSIEAAFDNAKDQNSKAEQNSIAYNTPKNGTPTAEKGNSSAAKAASSGLDIAKSNAGESKTDHSETALAKTTASGLVKEETVTRIAQNTNKNSSLSAVKSQAFLPENSNRVSQHTIAKNAGSKDLENITLASPETEGGAQDNSLAKASATTQGFKAPETTSIAKTSPPAKATPDIISQEPASAIIGENPEETLNPVPLNQAGASRQMLAVNSETPADSARALPSLALTALENSAGNEKTDAAPGVSKWSVAVVYSGLKFEQQLNIGLNPDATNSQYTPITVAFPANFEAEREFNENTKGLYSTKTQVMAGYQFASAWVLQSGLDLSSYAAETATNYMVSRKVNGIGSGSLAAHSEEMPVLAAVLKGQFYPDSAKEVKRGQVKVKYSYRYVGVPVALQGQLRLKDKLFAYAKAGFTLSRLVKNQILTNGNENGTDLASSTDSYEQWQVILNGGAGLGFKANQKYSFNAGAEVNCFTKGLIKDSPYLTSSLPYSFGLNAGLTYHF